MIIDTSIIDIFNCEGLNENSHWIFSKVVDGEILFELPKYDKSIVNKIVQLIIDELENFKPCNEKIILEIWPDFFEILSYVEVILAVGIPKPYDAMVRDGYIIFDIGNFLDYEMTKGKMISFVRNMLTHEAIHVLIQRDYPKEKNLEYISFDEGFAHLLANWEDVSTVDFDQYEDKYLTAKEKYFKVLEDHELDPDFREANEGPFWYKYAAIYGCLALAKNKDDLLRIYKKGAIK
ncbi:MAG: hypothetical protein LBN08_07515 [Lactobacillales bacterium]|jgi:hypothetical protein|nr:hypothetical protein [Lactobacillales bacterium]